MNVSVLTRPGCHLCEEAIGELREWLGERLPEEPRIEVELIDIEKDDELHRRYLERIPVIRIDGRDISDLAFDSELFEAAFSDRSEGAG
ncbi:MAG: glutaredoxin family protein [Solirubrobacterales bacterium]|nr:glutaredoxin family protein [Solirubrobacterales bacterium]